MTRSEGSPVPDGSSNPRRGNLGLVTGILAVAVAAALPLGLPSGTQSGRASTRPATSAGTAHVIDPEKVDRGVGTTAIAQAAHPAPTTTTSPPTAITPLATPAAAASPPPVAPAAAVRAPVAAPIAAVTPPTTVPSVPALVAEVVASGIDPGSNWTWSMGDTASQCGAIGGNNIATGCTFGAAGFARTVFFGSPTLALVAHELANAETENDAVPSLMSEVAIDEAGTSWSPIDAVASCLVEHFMGFEDVAAGTWQCPSSLATLVAQDIRPPASVSTAAPSP
jgi:hypothetical protein